MTDIHTPTERAPRPHDRIERPVEGRVVAGVAEGLGRRLGVGTGWIRLAFVVTSLFGGSGILAYVIGWLLMPDERDDESIAQRYIGNVGNVSTWVGVALIGVAVLIIIDQTGLISGELLFAAALIALGVMLYRGQEDARSRPDPAPPGDRPGVVVDDLAPGTPEFVPPGTGSPGSPTGELPAVESGPPEFDNPDYDASDASAEAIGGTVDAGRGGGEPPWVEPVVAAAPRPRRSRPPRERSVLGRLTVAVLLITLGGIATYDAAVEADVAYGVYLASFMIVIGAGLIVGAWIGRARWLVVPGLILLPMFVVVSVLPGGLTGDVGDRDISGVQLIEAGGSDDMAIGEFIVDLRDIPAGTEADLSVSLGIGHLVVVVPDDRTVEVFGDVGMGELVIGNGSSGGLGVERTRVFGEGRAELTIMADLGIGQLEIERRSASSFGDRGDFGCRPTSPDWPFAGELVCERSN